MSNELYDISYSSFGAWELPHISNGMNSTLRNALLALVITSAIFATGFWVSNSINEVRLDEVRSIESRIAVDILSSETQFDLLGKLSCSEISENTVLSSELNSLADRLAVTEARLGSENAEVMSLKRQYSLLEIKDYLLMQEVAEKCKLKPVFVLYFYSNEGDCPNCNKVGHVLTYLRQTYLGLRVYSFDYHLDLGALETLISINKVKPELPAFIVNGKSYYDLNELEDFEKILPLDKLATTTPEKN